MTLCHAHTSSILIILNIFIIIKMKLELYFFNSKTSTIFSYTSELLPSSTKYCPTILQIRSEAASLKVKALGLPRERNSLDRSYAQARTMAMTETSQVSVTPYKTASYITIIIYFENASFLPCEAKVGCLP